MNPCDISPELFAFSDSLKNRIMADIAKKSGWISFADYMQQVLYTPVAGYYSGGLSKLGTGGDFVTAPEMTDFYGRVLARAIVPLLKQTGANILELGAGTGKLAQDVLKALDAAGVRLDKYRILEVSSELRQRQQETLSSFDNVEWLMELPRQFDGVILANEVLDAMPVHLVRKTETEWHEVGVSVRDDRLAFSDRPCENFLANMVDRTIIDHENLPSGYMTEIHAHGHAFMTTLSEMMRRSNHAAAILVDYGFPAHEYYHPDRSMGTLMCHFRHRSHDDPFFLPGLQDVTAHVDFTEVAQTASDQGIDVICFASQASFLLAAGLPDLLSCDSEKFARDAGQLKAVQQLLSPAEMGELFKIIVLGHKIEPPVFMLDIDKSGRL